MNNRERKNAKYDANDGNYHTPVYHLLKVYQNVCVCTRANERNDNSMRQRQVIFISKHLMCSAIPRSLFLLVRSFVLSGMGFEDHRHHQHHCCYYQCSIRAKRQAQIK